MAFPFIFEENFEAGDKGGFDSESDTNNNLDFPHYSALAKIPDMEVPFRGAHCMRVVFNDTDDAILLEGDVDIADTATRHLRFYLFVSEDFTATADDTFNMLELQQAAGTPEVSLGFRITAATNLLEIGVGDGTAPTSFVEFKRGRWTCIELEVLVSTGGSGTVTLRVDGASVVALTSQTHGGAVGRAQLGSTLTLATTTGTMLIDQFVFDDARIFPITDRFKQNVHLTKTGHAFVGPGVIKGVSIQAGAAVDNVVKIFDTDVGNTDDVENQVFAAGNDIASETLDLAVADVRVRRGAYVQLSGTDPQAIIRFESAHSMSKANIKDYGIKRKVGPFLT